MKAGYPDIALDVLLFTMPRNSGLNAKCNFLPNGFPTCLRVLSDSQITNLLSDMNESAVVKAANNAKDEDDEIEESDIFERQ